MGWVDKVLRREHTKLCKASDGGRARLEWDGAGLVWMVVAANEGEGDA